MTDHLNWARWIRSNQGYIPLPRYLGLRPLAFTCRGCGELRTTPDHLLRHDSGTLPACPTCGRRKTSEYAQRSRQARDEKFLKRERANSARNRVKLQARTVETADHHREQWTSAELELVVRLPASEVALLTGRTLYAVKHMKRKVRSDPRYARLAGLATPVANLADPNNSNIAPTREGADNE